MHLGISKLTNELSHCMNESMHQALTDALALELKLLKLKNRPDVTLNKLGFLPTGSSTRGWHERTKQIHENQNMSDELTTLG